MLSRQFTGSEQFVRNIDAAVRQECTQAVTDTLRNSLCEMIRDENIQLPDEVMQCCGDHYARRELYHSEELGYSVIAMTWGPGQGTSIHDHHGMWCVEGVWSGSLEVTQYELTDQKQEQDQFEFRPVGSMQAVAGSAGSLIPPHEYHTIRNPSKTAPAVSVHIYKGALTCCSVFQPIGDNWFQRDLRQLGLD